ncbi:MAG: uncharacterized protein PWQ68_457 [Thermoanaerobacteraceae bacterium]|nr:uncharacterized protein [Thermoanaerobacteraceae bacterium]
MKVFIDSSAWIALVKRNDINHRKASDYFKTLIKDNALLITSNYVITESVNRILYDLDHDKAIKFLELIEEARNKNFLKIARVDEKIDAQAIDLFKKYADQKISIVDMTSFYICKSLGVDKVFSFDRHFKVLGLVVAP